MAQVPILRLDPTICVGSDFLHTWTGSELLQTWMERVYFFHRPGPHSQMGPYYLRRIWFSSLMYWFWFSSHMYRTGQIFVMVWVPILRLDPTIGVVSDFFTHEMNLIFFTHKWNGSKFFLWPRSPFSDWTLLFSSDLIVFTHRQNLNFFKHEWNGSNFLNDPCVASAFAPLCFRGNVSVNIRRRQSGRCFPGVQRPNGFGMRTPHVI